MAPQSARKSWPVQDAKARFSEFLEASLSEGPQIVTRRGVETAVLVPVAQWRQLEQAAKPTLKDLLLAEGPRAEILIPARGRLHRRPTRLMHHRSDHLIEDALIAATAVAHHFVVVTRNVRDFARLDVETFDPWT